MAALDDVYRKFGSVSEAAQLLETELGTLLLDARAREAGLFKTPDAQVATDLLERVNRLTLGALLRHVCDSDAPLQEGIDLLTRALSERNRLTHSFYRQHNFRRNSPEGRAIMLEDLEAIHATLLDAYKLALRVSGIDLDAATLDSFPAKHLPLK